MNLPEATIETRALVDEVNHTGGTYHRMEMQPGLVVQGKYDMTHYLAHYGIPDRLEGKTVLDVGTASGFFAFECARRGARVTAIDIWDGGLFDRLARAQGLEASYICLSLDDLTASFGQFDLVICGSVLLHYQDIFGGLQRLRAVCRERTIISTLALDAPLPGHRALCEFIGVRGVAKGGEYWTHWSVTPPCLRKMLLVAGFASVSEPVLFTLRPDDPQDRSVSPHVVVHAFV